MVCANPQLLVADVEGCLLPLLDYLSARLGLQAGQVARCLEEERAYGAPETLDTLSEWQAGRPEDRWCLEGVDDSCLLACWLMD